MGIAEELKDKVSEIIATPDWDIQSATKIPSNEDVGLGRVGKRIEVVVLYSDLAGWTNLVEDYKDWFVAEIAKSFLFCSVKIIRNLGGVVASFDGDRVMAIFHGGQKNSTAAKCALQINYAVTKIITPQIQKTYLKQSEFMLGHCTGIDRSEVLVTRSGIRNNNDLVWIGRAPNYAAKLSGVRSGARTIVTTDVYDWLQDYAKLGGDPPRNMWTSTTVSIAGASIPCHESTWHWKP